MSSGVLRAGRPSDGSDRVTLTDLAKPSPKTKVNFELRQDLHKKLKVYAAQQGKSVREILTDHIESLLDEGS